MPRGKHVPGKYFWAPYKLEKAKQKVQNLPPHIGEKALQLLSREKPPIKPSDLSEEDKLFACLVWSCGCNNRVVERVMGLVPHAGCGVGRIIQKSLRDSLPMLQSMIDGLPDDFRTLARSRVKLQLCKNSPYAKSKLPPDVDPEVKAIDQCVKSLELLSNEQRGRIVGFLASKYGNKA